MAYRRTQTCLFFHAELSLLDAWRSSTLFSSSFNAWRNRWQGLILCQNYCSTYLKKPVQYTIQATTGLGDTVSAETTGQIVQKANHGKLACFINWFWGHDCFRGLKGSDRFSAKPVVDCSRFLTRQFRKCWCSTAYLIFANIVTYLWCQTPFAVLDDGSFPQATAVATGRPASPAAGVSGWKSTAVMATSVGRWMEWPRCVWELPVQMSLIQQLVCVRPLHLSLK